MSQKNTQTTYYKSRETILAQLSAAGYNTDEFHMRIAEFSSSVDTWSFCARHAKSGARAYVNYAWPKISGDVMELLVKRIEEEGALYREDSPFDKTQDSILFVTPVDPSQSIQDQIRTLFLAKGVYIAWQTVERSQYNVLEHSLVPNFIVLPERVPEDIGASAKGANTEEMLARNAGDDVRSVEELLQKYHTTRDNLPTESRFSPPLMAKLVRPGQVVCYYRPSSTAMVAPHWVMCA